MVYLTASNRILCPIKKSAYVPVCVCVCLCVCKSVYKHSPLGELNATLEIVFSTQVSLAISVDSVWRVHVSNLHKGKLPARSTKELSRRKSCGEGGGKTIISVFHLSFVQGRQITS